MWWRDGVVYQIYPRSFADSNGDGVGDLQGVIAHLDYLDWLGVDGIWLNPVTPSPNDDWGYDVSDYCNVHPELGTLDDLDELIRAAGARDIEVLLDFVPNHTSDRHPWFIDARTSRHSDHRSWYVWADPKPDGSPPNNWLSAFGGGPAWTLDQASGQYYLHNFLPSQPDLNWWNDEVRDAFDDILRFWLGRGVAGFRIDVVHGVVKDRQLRDNLPATEADHPIEQALGQLRTYNMDQPEVHDVIRRWRALCNSYEPERVLVGETFLMDIARMARYYGTGDELHLAFNFPFVLAPFDPERLRAVAGLTEATLPPDAWPAWTASNHDVGRFPTRWCDGDPNPVRAVLVMLLALRGTPVLYYGDEIGMPETVVPPDRELDPVARVGKRPGRDRCRTPMHWSSEPGAGFTTAGTEPWLPFGDASACNVADQRGDPSSPLSLTRGLIALRRELPDLRVGAYEALRSPDGVWAWRRGAHTVVALNLSDRDLVQEDLSGTIRLSTHRERASETVQGRVELAPWEGVVLHGD